MDDDEAIRVVTKELSKSDSPLMVFKPAEVKESFLIGEVFIAGAGIFIMNAFFKGAKAALENRLEELGKKVTNWLVDKIEGLFRGGSKLPTPDKASVKEYANKVSLAAAKLGKQKLKSALDASEQLLAKTLIDQGLTPTRAAEIARVVRGASETLIKVK